MKRSRARQGNNTKNARRRVPTHTGAQDQSLSREDGDRGKKPQPGPGEAGTGNLAHPRPDPPQAS